MATYTPPPQPFGKIEVHLLDPKDVGATFQSALDGTIARYTWLPPDDFAAKQQNPFTFALDCLTTRYGDRRFTLVDLPSDANSIAKSRYGLISEISGFVDVATVGGANILMHQGIPPDDEVIPSYYRARIFSQYAEHLREFLGKSIDFAKLFSSQSGRRRYQAARALLPEDLGLDNQGNADPWDEKRLQAEGILAAKAVGIENPTPQEWLRFGLMEAAKLAPLCDLTNKESLSLVRLSLFALNAEHYPLDIEQLQDAQARAYESLEAHLNDTPEDFRRWVEDPKSDLPRSISRSENCKVKNRRQARVALLEIGWRATQLIGQCIDAQLRVFRDAMPEPLTEDENYVFEQAFLSNPAFGGLPLLLVYDRFDFLREAVLNIWNNPGDRDAVSILHRMMYYYSELANNYRQWERAKKRRPK